MSTFINDIKYAFRQMFKKPGFTFITVLTLTLGIGICTTVFNLFDAVILRRLPFREPDLLLRVWDTNHKRNLTSFPASIPNFLSWQERSKTFAGFAAWRYGTATVGSGEASERLDVVRISANLLPLLGHQPVKGRGFLPEEDQPGRDHTVMLSQHVWKERFASDPAVIGRELLLDGETHTIVGIAPHELESLVGADLWKPLAPDPAVDPRGNHYLRVIGRLRPDTSVAAAQTEMTSIAKQLAVEFPDSNTNWSIRLESFYDWIVPVSVRTALTVLLIAACCVLLIACANVANLLIIHTQRRHQELALRTALGANRWQLFQQVLRENTVLIAIGTGLGLMLTHGSLRLLQAFQPENLPRLDEVGFDARALLFAVGLSALNAVAVSSISILIIRRLHLHQSLKQGGRSSGLSLQRHLIQRGLVAGQVALSLMLLIGAALLVQSFSRLLDNELGFEPDHLLTFQVSPPASRYSKASSLEYYRRLTESLDALPGVVNADVTSGPPFCHATFRFTSRISTRQSQVFTPDELLSIEFSHVGPHYFETMGASIVEGRPFTLADNEGVAPVAILNEAAACAFWPEDSAVGKTVFWGQPFTVVGVVRDMHNVRRNVQARPAFYLSVNQQVWSTMTVVVRYRGSLETLISSIRRETRALDPELPIFNVRTMTDMVSGASAHARFSTWLLGVFAASALALAFVGLYGVTSCLVTERTREYGIRRALGALPHDVQRLILRQNVSVLTVGLLIGTSASLAGTRLLAGLLYEIRPTDLTTFVGAALFLTIVTLLACWIPARRAAKIDPMEALRYE